jgi:hypothetical protein
MIRLKSSALRRMYAKSSSLWVTVAIASSYALTVFFDRFGAGGFRSLGDS